MSLVTNEPVPGGTHPAKRILFGAKLPNDKLEGQLLPKHLALPIFASDPLSSVAYAPQELLMILMIGGLSFLAFAPWIAAIVVVLLIVVVLSYRQLIKAYPSGGGDYEVAHKNLGQAAGLVVASALLVDYILTVAVSVASGVDNIISAVPVLADFRVEMAVGFVIILAGMNLRGVSEASKAFALPTYIFVGSVFLMIVTGFVRILLGHPPVAETAHYAVHAESVTQAGVLLLVLRAFSSGCSALTGVEAISNGVPAFRKPKVKNAQLTLTYMGGIAIVLFLGLLSLAVISGVHYVENPCSLVGLKNCASTPQRSLMAQVASAVFGDNSIPFFIVQAATAVVLLLAANTAFNGFPLLGAVLARDRYAPKSLSSRGDRLVFSNGVIALSAVAIALLLATGAVLTTLIQLYIIGVFVSFTLGQTGMIRHWIRGLRDGSFEGRERPRAVRSLCINSIGALMTFSVLIVVTITKFTHGAYIVYIVMPILWLLMFSIQRYYAQVEREIAVDTQTTFGNEGDHAIVLVGRMQKPILKALDYAIAARHESLEAVHIATDEEETKALIRDWKRMNIAVPLRIIDSPYREVAVPLIQYIKGRRKEVGSEVVTVYTPIYVVGHWWELILHNHRSRRLRKALMLVHGVTVAIVPWNLESSSRLYTRRLRPLPGQARRGEPVRKSAFTRRQADAASRPQTRTVRQGTPGCAVVVAGTDPKNPAPDPRAEIDEAAHLDEHVSREAIAELHEREDARQR